MISGGYQIISCSLRRRAGQNRGGDLHEIMSSHALTKVSHDLASQNDFAFYLRIAEIQITVFQTDILVSLFGMVDLEGQFVVTAFTQHFNLRRHYFNVSGRKLCILAASLTNDTIYLNGRLIIQLRQLIHDLLSLYYDLSRSVEIS